MTVEHRRIWAWFGLALLGTVTAIAVVYVISSDQGPISVRVMALATVATSAASGIVWLWAHRRPEAALLPVERAADQLAEQLRRSWELVATERGLRYSTSIALQWRWSQRQVTGPVTQAVVGVSGTRFTPLPGMAPITVEQLRSGFSKDLFGVYGGLDSGRVLILGAPGAGKTGAAIRLILDALIHRSAVETTEEQAKVPVPVLLTAYGWNPSEQLFKNWLADRLAREYRLLRALEYGRDTAMRLIEGGYLAVILDGLDEMPEALRQVALQALDEQANFRLVLLARSEELVAAASGGHLRGAAALEICPIGSEQAAEYVASCQMDPLPQTWQRVVDHLREHPGSALAQALDTPLMLTLVRDIYRPGGRVDELTNSDQFPSREAIEDNLLSRVLPTAYAQHPGQPASPYTVDEAERWLAHLARNMNEEGTRDLAWWEIPRWISVWPRALVATITLYLVFALSSGLRNGVLSKFGNTLNFLDRSILGFTSGVIEGLPFALLIGLGYGLVSTPDKRPYGRLSRLGWSTAASQNNFIVGFIIGFLGNIWTAVSGISFEVDNDGGLGNFSGVEFVGGLWFGLARGIGDGLVAGLLIGLGFVLVSGLGKRSHGHSGQLRQSSVTNRSHLISGLRFGLTTGFTAGLLTGLKDALIFGLVAGLGYGLLDGVIVGIGYGFAAGLGRKSPSRIRWNKTDLRTALITGLVIGLVVGWVPGFIFVLVVGLGGRPLLQLGRLRWKRINVRTDLIIGLGSGLIVGLLLWLNLSIGNVHIFGLGAGLSDGFIAGLVVGPLTTLLVVLGRPSADATTPSDPRSLWRRERQLRLRVGIAFGIVFGLLVGLNNGSELAVGIQVGLGAGLMSSATWAATLASAQLWRRGQAPLHLLRFLEDARARQILRTVGPVYQFRHARLQDQLAETRISLPLGHGDRPH